MNDEKKVPQPPAEAQPVLERIASRLRAAGASLPAPQVTGTVDGAVITGLSIALALVEAESGTPPPSAPVGVEGWRVEPVEDDPDMLAVETPDGRTWFAKRGDRVFELAEALALAQRPPAEAQQQGGWDLDEVVCLACGDRIMPMGQVCHSCSHPVPAPPSAPVGVDEPPKGWNPCSRCRLKGKSDDCERCGGSGWRKRCNALDCLEYGCNGYGFCLVTKDELAAALAQQPAAVDGAMVERLALALAMYEQHRTTMQSLASSVGDFLRDYRALAAHPGGSDNDR